MLTKQIVLASRPSGMPTLENFEIVEKEIPAPSDQQVLLRTLYISVDPYLRGRMREGKSYVPPFEVGQVIESAVVGEVVDSRYPSLEKGDLVTGMMGWATYNVTEGSSIFTLEDSLQPPSIALGVLGIPGLTAYFGLLDIAKIHSGETVVVSGAAGAVGMTACQIAKIKGCRVVGIAGGEEKTRYLKDVLRVDAVVDYKSHTGVDALDKMRRALQEACPKGVDVYFDNVGGVTSDAVMFSINNGARIALCGQISMYNSQELDTGLRPQPFLLVKTATMQGFLITHYFARFGEAREELAGWMKSGELRHEETVTEGFENTPAAFIGLFSGNNLGKQVVKVL